MDIPVCALYLRKPRAFSTYVLLVLIYYLWYLCIIMLKCALCTPLVSILYQEDLLSLFNLSFFTYWDDHKIFALHCVERQIYSFAYVELGILGWILLDESEASFVIPLDLISKSFFLNKLFFNFYFIFVIPFLFKLRTWAAQRVMLQAKWSTRVLSHRQQGELEKSHHILMTKN